MYLAVFFVTLKPLFSMLEVGQELLVLHFILLILNVCGGGDLWKLKEMLK